MSRRKVRWMMPLAGIAAAFVFAECMLRLFATGATLNGLPKGETYRQYSEGIATSHFNDDTSRATGNAALPAAETVLILGDSHVPAVQIEDSETMGSVLERMARRQGIRLNVRQFGWSGEGYGIARTFALGPDLAAQIHPLRVVVVLSEGALRTYPSDPAKARRLRSEPPPGMRNHGPAQRAARLVAHYSVVAHLLYARVREARMGAEQVPTASTEACVHDSGDARFTVVSELLHEFGHKLLILYAPEVGLGTPAEPDCWETLLLPQCEQLGVQCISLRSRMIEARRAHVLMRGFHNSQVGVGHLNAAGHELAAQELFENLSPEMVTSR